MTTPVTTISRSGKAHQNPRTLCQFQSRARPHAPPRNSVIFLRLFQVHSFGHHKNGPVTTRTRKLRLQAPVIARPQGRLRLPSPATDASPRRWRRMPEAGVILRRAPVRCRDSSGRSVRARNRTTRDRSESERTVMPWAFVLGSFVSRPAIVPRANAALLVQVATGKRDPPGARSAACRRAGCRSRT